MSADELLREVERCFIDDSGYFKSEWYGDLKSRIEAHLSAPELAALREKCDTLLADNYSLRAELEKRK
jgi:hypothetical protein